jgi:hypothetical protein
MSGLPWFEMDVNFADDPKIVALASRLREPLADAYVLRVYAYCYRHGQDRFDAQVASDTVEKAAGWRGRRGGLFDALFHVGVLERDAGKVIVHGVLERIGPHLAKRVKDAIRKRESRENATKNIGVLKNVTPDGARTALGRREESQGDKDKDKDRDLKPPIIGQSFDGGLAGESVNLRAFREDLSVAYGLSGLIAIAKPEEAQEVAAFFDAQLAAVGPEWLLRDCIDSAAKAKTTPGSLKWLKPWLEKLHTPHTPKVQP